MGGRKLQGSYKEVARDSLGRATLTHHAHVTAGQARKKILCIICLSPYIC